MQLIYAASSPTGIHKPESLRRRTGHRDSVNVRGVLSQRFTKVCPDTADVCNIAAASPEIGFVATKCSADRGWLAIVAFTVATATSNGTGSVLRLPEIERIVAVRFFKIVGTPNRFRPIASLVDILSRIEWA